VISIKKYLDISSGQVEQTASEPSPLVTALMQAYRSTIASVGENGARAIPAVASDLLTALARLQRGLEEVPSFSLVQETEKSVAEQLDVWGMRAAAPAMFERLNGEKEDLALDFGDLAMIDRDNADATWLVSYTEDDGPVHYAAWNRADKQVTDLFDHQPALSNYRLAHMEPFAFSTRDGMVIYFPCQLRIWVRFFITFGRIVKRNLRGEPWQTSLVFQFKSSQSILNNR